MLIRFAGRYLSSRGPGARLVILMYHRILRQHDTLVTGAVTERDFAAQLKILSGNFTPLHLADATARLQKGTLPPRAFVITFDDGYRDNYEVALPLLEKYGVPATFFIATGFLDGGIMWNDSIIESVRGAGGSEIDLTPLRLGKHSIAGGGERSRTIEALIRRLKYEPAHKRQELVSGIFEISGVPPPLDIMMSSEQVRNLSSRGMEIGGHTVSHPILSRLDTAHAKWEILEGRKRLEEITGGRVSSFAYPNGRPERDYRREHVDVLHDNGFDCGVTTSWGCATSGSDIMQLPRIAPWDRPAYKFAARVMLAYRQDKVDYL